VDYMTEVREPNWAQKLSPAIFRTYQKRPCATWMKTALSASAPKSTLATSWLVNYPQRRSKNYLPRSACYGLYSAEKAKEVRDTSQRMSTGRHGKVVGVKVFSRANGHELKAGVIMQIQVFVAQMRKISVGDKLGGRHGNKGLLPGFCR